MDADDGSESQPRPSIHFQLQFDKPLSSQVKLAEWNPEKDLLAMVSDESKVMLHRLNWQRLWTVSPGGCVTSLCWHPDGKVLALGLEDGNISLHDVENGRLLRSMKSHQAAVTCLNWEEDTRPNQNGIWNHSYEDRTSRFYPSAPRTPRFPGVVPGESALLDDGQDSIAELSNAPDKHFNILCSADKDGNICFSIFGIFPIGKCNIHSCGISAGSKEEKTIFLSNCVVSKVALSKDLCHLIVTCSGELAEDLIGCSEREITGGDSQGVYCLVLDTSIFKRRKEELYQVARQASNIEDLLVVVRSSISVMHKQWKNAMNTFREKFDSLSNLIKGNHLDSSPEEEFLSLLGGARTSPAIHQFLVNSLSEVGVKRLSKTVCGAGKELQLIVLNHLQPAADIISFRMGELKAQSKWRARYRGIGLDETLTDSAAERAGMLLVQVERFIKVLSTVIQQYANFFSWLLKCIKLLMSEPIEQPIPYNSELVIIFLKFLYNQDPVNDLLDLSKVDHEVQIDVQTMQRATELIEFGGFTDTGYLKRTLVKMFQEFECSFKEAVQMPFSTISTTIVFKNFLPLFPLSTPSSANFHPISLSFYEAARDDVPANEAFKSSFVDYICFQVPNHSFANLENCMAIVRGDVSGDKSGKHFLEAIFLGIPSGFSCVDLALYKNQQIVMLLNEKSSGAEDSTCACLLILSVCDLPFVQVSRYATRSSFWELNELKESVVHLQLENEKTRTVPHTAIPPLIVSSSRGVACVLAVRKRALVYILEEDEDSDEE
ncbi:hypothetical protein MLD38_021122 [Melastoma candidum]|uniref:Uncharacterized protein n=1 Tax=Melastoma candidum TaxID=119954 RepID=A0ACB9QIX5_9MYRT|nr:hypothetical protein MLD38_021122 [Melastoma candidum]